MIAVLTAPRPGVSYLAATLASVDASARDPRRAVFFDGGDAPAVPPRWTAVPVTKPAGSERQNRWAAWAAIGAAAEVGEDVILLEDDVRFCLNGMAHAEAVRVPGDVAFVSLFAPFGDLTMPEGIWRAAMDQYGYAQALKLPLRTCQELIAAEREMRDAPFGTTDGVLRRMGERRRWLYGTHYPGLVQHVGAVSIVGPGGSLVGRRVSHAYAGDDFDARSLLLHHYT